jgi:hypothetical protein
VLCVVIELQLDAVFASSDFGGDGILDKSELLNALRLVGVRVAKQDVSFVYQKCVDASMLRQTKKGTYRGRQRENSERHVLC